MVQGYGKITEIRLVSSMFCLFHCRNDIKGYILQSMCHNLMKIQTIACFVSFSTALAMRPGMFVRCPPEVKHNYFKALLVKDERAYWDRIYDNTDTSSGYEQCLADVLLSQSPSMNYSCGPSKSPPNCGLANSPVITDSKKLHDGGGRSFGKFGDTLDHNHYHDAIYQVSYVCVIT